VTRTDSAAGEPAREAAGAGEADRLVRKSIDTIRTLSIDAVEAAGCGHPGTPMALAPLAYVLFRRVLKHDPSDPAWPDRDRFVLSAGHASMLLYASLHLSGYDLSLDDLKAFRQWGSKTPGHPERGHAPGVETTTGPLGQGVGNAVGMALAERMLAARFPDLVDHRTWVVASDGDLMEGVSGEASSLAGHWGLSRLCVFWDDNSITIDGPTSLAFSEDVARRYEAYGWNVLSVEDGNDVDALERAARGAVAETRRPTLVRVRTRIGWGSPNREGTSKAHGEALGAAEARLAKRAYGWPEESSFLVPDDVAAHMRPADSWGVVAHAAWRERLERRREGDPAEVARFEDAVAGRLPEGLERALPRFGPESGGPKKAMATRKASAATLAALAKEVPALVGGAADLAGSVGTTIPGGGEVARGSFSGRTIHFGVREHGMGAILNGLALHGGFRPFGGTFLVFSDYLRPSLRLAALMRLPVAYVFTHDSVGLGEDGPTHQPVEHLAALRAVPGLQVIRPADAAETAVAWQAALETEGPTALVLTRQDVPVLDRERLADARGLLRGGYVLEEEGGEDGEAPDVVLVATGSEVAVALEAAATLRREGWRPRVVSLPSWERFGAQPDAYRDAVLPPGVPRVTVEAASPFGWERFAGPDGRIVGIDRFGASAPGARVLRELGIDAASVAAAARDVLRRVAPVSSRPPKAPRQAARKPSPDRR
jgi:transketolase